MPFKEKTKQVEAMRKYRAKLKVYRSVGLGIEPLLTWMETAEEKTFAFFRVIKLGTNKYPTFVDANSSREETFSKIVNRAKELGQEVSLEGLECLPKLFRIEVIKDEAIPEGEEESSDKMSVEKKKIEEESPERKYDSPFYALVEKGRRDRRAQEEL